jgi:apolipoprotein N-acyltransferase
VDHEEEIKMDRRQFVQTSTMGMSTLASGLGIKNLQAQPTSVAGRPAALSENVVGRPVRIVSIGFTQGCTLEQIAGLVDQEGGRGTDLIALPETWRGQDLKSPESLEGPTIKTIAALARKHQTYIVCPIDRLEGKRRYNSSVLLDRQGRVVSIYNKLYPVWLVECMKEPPQEPVHRVLSATLLNSTLLKC